MTRIVNRCHDVAGKQEEEINAELKDVANLIFSHSNLPHEKHENGVKSLGSKLTYIYLMCKFLNILNIMANISLFTFFVGKGNFGWAFTIINEALKGNFWDSTGYFPRVRLISEKLLL